MSTNTSLVYTNDKCIGCNKCVNACPAMGACMSVDVDGEERRIDVNGGRRDERASLQAGRA
ncbi:MAG: 4Fe-4S dicluster domain-containing protein [Lachnospiraceae bacterium]|nr:4Fe-4S dicluster domain-containing protein [Lachnospiraceae bacterium]